MDGTQYPPYELGHITGVINRQNVLFNRMSRHVSDLRDIIVSNASKNGNHSESATQIARLMTFSYARNVTLEAANGSSGEVVTVVLP